MSEMIKEVSDAPNNLRDLIAAYGKTQADLARLLGLSGRASEYLSGQREISRDNLRKIAVAWGIPADQLLGITPAEVRMEPERLALLRYNAMKPEEIDDPATREQRVQELVRWFARYAEGHANPKWVEGHAFDLAYYLASAPASRAGIETM